VEVGIVGYGVYIPRYRLRRQDFLKVWGAPADVEEKALPGFDEDVITMASEACFNALESAGTDPSLIDAVYFASTSPPHAGDLNSTIIAEVLGLSPRVKINECTGLSKAGTMAFWNCAQAILSGSIRTGLVIASDHLLGARGSSSEFNLGAGAAALVLGEKGIVAVISDFETYNSYFPYRWKEETDRYFQDYSDPRFEREYGFERHVMKALQALKEKMGLEPKMCHHVVLPQPDERLARTMAKQLGLKPNQVDPGLVVSKIGDAGAALPFIGLARVLDQSSPDETILIGTYSTGSGCDILVFKTTARIRERRPSPHSVDFYLNRKEWIDYILAQRLEGFLQRGGIPIPVPTSLHGYWRNFSSRLGLVAGRCRHCGAVNYPPRKHICMECHKPSEFDSVRLNRRGVIYTIVVVHYAPPGVEGPYAIAIADVGDGVRILGRMADCDPNTPQIGTPVEIILRKLMVREGIIDYAYAFRPLTP